MGPPGARFDNLVDRTGKQFPAPARTIVATRVEDVRAALDAVDAVTGEGCWAYGFVCFEAASGLDPALTTHVPRVDDPPLVWFAVVDAPRAASPLRPAGSYELSAWRFAPGADAYLRDVDAVREHIAAGRTYQVNLTARLHAAFAGDPAALYAALTLRQRSRYAALIDTGSHVIASASPELFFRWDGDRLITRPMKGTAPRGRTAAEDDERVRVLASSAKERAENVIVVDLLRNDLGRIATTGSVHAARIGTVERYETVLQLTSEVSATVGPRTSLADVFTALFPSGSVTGAPKPSTMAIIRDLESTPRGAYCGAIGWVAPPQHVTRAQFSVAIRTVVLDRARGSAVYGAGGGITWSSDPQAELAELLLKTRVAEPSGEPDEFELLETMRFDQSLGLRNLAGHLDRMSTSARYFGFAFVRSTITDALDASLAGRASVRVRLTLDRDGTPRVTTAELPQPDAVPITLSIDDDPIDTSLPWPFHKTTRRAPYIERAARHDTDDVVLVNEHGRVTETTIANLAVRLDGRWWTPPAADGCLPGVERARLVMTGELRERPLTPDDVRRASGLALVSSLRGWRAATLARV